MWESYPTVDEADSRECISIAPFGKVVSGRRASQTSYTPAHLYLLLWSKYGESCMIGHSELDIAES